MSIIQEKIAEYKRDHTHPMNQATHAIGIPLVVLSFPALLFSWKWAVGFFVVGWIFQFIGHAFEGKPPSFFRDPKFLLVGVTWFLQRISGGRLFGNKS